MLHSFSYNLMKQFHSYKKINEAGDKEKRCVVRNKLLICYFEHETALFEV